MREYIGDNIIDISTRSGRPIIGEYVSSPPAYKEPCLGNYSKEEALVCLNCKLEKCTGGRNCYMQAKKEAAAST